MQLNQDGTITLPGGKKVKGATQKWLDSCTPNPKAEQQTPKASVKSKK